MNFGESNCVSDSLLPGTTFGLERGTGTGTGTKNAA